MKKIPYIQTFYDENQKNHVDVEIFNGWLINSLQSHKISEIPFLSSYTITQLNEKNYIFTNQILGQLLVFNYSKTRFVHWISTYINGTISEAEYLYNMLKNYTTAEPVNEGNGSLV
uniref:Uncharacterized protein n=1 Tax=Parastrongyloides trichosuri TaxID=131310 RepID=A0A0N4ZRG3_PARTI